MNIVCLDMEGVLVPEIWVAFAKTSGIPELKRTTRDEPDYDKLMRWRMQILREHGLGLKEIQDVISKIDPLPGAKEFVDRLRAETQVIVLSDTFSQFAQPLMKKLGWPTIFCNELVVGDDGMLEGIKMRCEHSKLTTVKGLQAIGFIPSPPATASTIWKCSRPARRVSSSAAPSRSKRTTPSSPPTRNMTNSSTPSWRC